MASMKVKMAAMGAMVIGMSATFFVFMLRYAWYTTPQNTTALNVGFGTFLLVCGMAWFILPSKILMFVACVLLFSYPPLYDASSFVRLDWKFFPFVAICMLFLVAGIEMRRRSRRNEVSEVEAGSDIRTRTDR